METLDQILKSVNDVAARFDSMVTRRRADSSSADRLFKAGTDESAFNSVFSTLGSLPAEELYEVARDYLNRPSGGSHPYKFKTKSEALYKIRDKFLERAQLESKNEIITRMMTRR